MERAIATGRSLMLLVDHTDAEREYDYRVHPTGLGRLEVALPEARQRGWHVVDTKSDWRRIFPFQWTEEGAIMIYGISVAAGSASANDNVSSRKQLMILSPEGQRYAMAPMRLFMHGLATWTLLLLVYNQYEMYRIAHAGPEVDVAGGSRSLRLDIPQRRTHELSAVLTNRSLPGAERGQTFRLPLQMRPLRPADG
jgi:hypothetical protein